MHKPFSAFAFMATTTTILSLGSTPAAAQDFITFQSPTGNIHCYIATWNPAEARCDIIDYTPSFRTAPRGCDLDWGNAFVVEEKGPGLLGCVGDTAIDPNAPVLDYGHSVSGAGLTCTSATTGMTCTNVSGGGFTVSRGSQQVF